jgi:hypothetical protein
VARAGSFGRLPRAAPDLSGAIAALQREAQARIDQNFVDAWKNGGKVNGSAVTDSRLLTHFHQRRDELDKSDPQWTTWDDRITQYTFSIDESKEMVKFDNGKVSEAHVAQFYKDWMAKTPKNNEFYRTLEKQAGKWGAAARAKSSASNAAAKAAAHQKWADNFFKKNVEPGETANNAILEAAKQYGAAPPNATDLSQIDKNTVGYQKVLDILDGGVPEDPGVSAILDKALKSIRLQDPGFSWSQKNVSDVIGKSRENLPRLIHRSTTKGEATMWKKHQEYVTHGKGMVDQADELKKAFDASQDFSTNMAACKGDMMCEKTAQTSFRDILTGIEKVLVTGNPNTTNPDVAGPIGETRRQMDALIAGKPIASAGAPNIFDVTQPGYDPSKPTSVNPADNSSPWTSGGMVGLSQGNADKHDNLVNGGWISYEPSAHLIDPQTGQPALTVVVHGPGDPKPANAVEVPSADGGAIPTTGYTGGGMPIQTTTRPTAFITPQPVIGIGQDVNGVPVDGSQKRVYDQVDFVDQSGAQATMYRVGDGTDTSPYIYMSNEPTFDDGKKTTVPQGTQGQRAVAVGFPAVTVPDPVTGNPKTTFVATQTGTHNPAQALPSGALVQGSYYTPKGAELGAYVTDTYAKHNPNDAEAIVNKALGQAKIDAASLALTDPAAAAKMNTDITSASQLSTLAKLGQTGKVLDDNFRALNSFKPEEQKYVDQLTKRGFSVNAQDVGDIHARVNLLAGLDKYDADHPITSPVMPITGYSGFGGFPTSGVQYPVYGQQAQQDQNAAAKADIFNPQVSVSRINVPGVPNQFVNTMTPDQQSAFNAWATQFAIQVGTGGVPLSMGGAGIAPPLAPVKTPEPPKTDVPPPPPPTKTPDVPTTSVPNVPGTGTYQGTVPTNIPGYGASGPGYAHGPSSVQQQNSSNQQSGFRNRNV